MRAQLNLICIALTCVAFLTGASWRDASDAGCDQSEPPSNAIVACTDFIEQLESHSQAKAEALLVRGIAFARTGNIERGRDDFDRVLELPDVHADTLFLATLFIRLHFRDIDLAHEFAKAAIAREPLHAKANELVVQIHKSRLDWPAVIDVTTTMIDRGPRNGQMHLDRGLALAALGNLALALQDFDRAVELWSDYGVYKYRAAAHLELGHLQAAVTDIDTWLEVEKPDFMSMSIRGTAYQRLGQYDRAAADYLKALELDPDHTDAPTLRDWLEENTKRS